MKKDTGKSKLNIQYVSASCNLRSLLDGEGKTLLRFWSAGRNDRDELSADCGEAALHYSISKDIPRCSVFQNAL